MMEVCRMRNTPIITFINKLDREGMGPLDILDDIENKLQIECVPLSWPIGMGKRFRGVYNLYHHELHLFTLGKDTAKRNGIVIKDLSDSRLDEYLEGRARELRDDIELIEGAANPFELEHYLNGNQTPVFFGSAINNFGVKEMLDAFVEMAPPPDVRATVSRDVSPYEKPFSGFAFKIQANMNPAHRDRIAFIRICSGKFTRGMKVMHHRIDKEVSEAFPGDIIGIYNHGTIKIGDTFSEKEPLKFTGIPNFAPDHFRRVILKNPLKIKQLQKGLIQLGEEGAVQVFRPVTSNEYLLGVVGLLQFDITMARLKSEYGVDAAYEPVVYKVARWVDCGDSKKMAEFEKKNSACMARDSEGTLAFLTTSEWELGFYMEKWPDISFYKTREIA